MEVEGNFQSAALNRQRRTSLSIVDHSEAENKMSGYLRDSPSNIENEYLLKTLSPQTSTSRLPDFDCGRTTKILAYCGLVVTWLLIACCITFGVVCIVKGPASSYLYPTAMADTSRGVEVLALVVNTLLTFCLDSLGFIHGSSLRWALAREGRLQHNTNLRLFKSAQNQPQNSWLANSIDGISLIICYAATSQLFALGIVVAEQSDPLPWFDGYYVNGVALLMLAGGLALKASISSWIVISSSHAILTWNSNPLNSALTLVHNGLGHRKNRCMLSVKQANVPAIPTRPTRKQPSSTGSVRSVRYVVMFAWTLPTLALGWLLSVFFIFRRATLEYPAVHFSWAWQFDAVSINLPRKGALTLILAVLFMAAIQAAQTMCLHAVELIVNISRDEKAWRSAACNTGGGARLQTSALSSASLSWENMGLFVAKTVLHWLMGQAVIIEVEKLGTDEPMVYWFNMGYLPILAYFVGALLLAIFTTALAFRRPKGPQPAAYGHFQTLADLIDDWMVDEKGRFWWGDKGVGENGVRHAGTSCKKGELGYIDMDASYAGSR
ncbi:uncharacterized protein LY89DRAFT_714133 [Mollisia scopiformis]|uniref:Uncharacterized protein n=1 Tax=Mollisia scopiformis TaxID=149040 RepID=A0A194XRF2_MOLSC|nr:uncharacterized protein LY89DRAFT_714133 [Mollisia scopiformis]KUJ22307.1 hypothetical protein LY89DRAFT_714133 [Mollisia scopiformis]